MKLDEGNGEASDADFFRVEASNTPNTVNDGETRYFRTLDGAKEYAGHKERNFRCIWISEWGRTGKSAENWICFYWSDETEFGKVGYQRGSRGFGLPDGKVRLVDYTLLCP